MMARLGSSQRKEGVWRLVTEVPRGAVSTYGDIARALRPPCNPRFVGWALRQAPPGLALPWHRVLGAGGRIALTGPSALEQRVDCRPKAFNSEVPKCASISTAMAASTKPDFNPAEVP